jgi:hypothetical protein
MQTAAKSLQVRADASSNWEAHAAIMARLGYERDESNQWVQRGGASLPASTESSVVVPTAWPMTDQVVRRKGRRKSERAATSDEAGRELEVASGIREHIEPNQ